MPKNWPPQVPFSHMNPIFEQLQSEIAKSLEGLNGAQTQMSPANDSGKWTIQQIIQHLCLTYSSTDAVISNRLDKDRPTHAIPTFPQRCAQFFVTKLKFFPTGRGAPPIVMPPEAPVSLADRMSGTTLAEETARHLARTDEFLENAYSRFGPARFASHSVLGPLSAAQWRCFHLVHGRHHLKQIWAIRREHQL